MDPGLINTGFGVIDVERKGKYRAIEFGAIRPSPKQPLEVRLLTIFRDLTDIIARHHPQRVGVEGIYQAKNVRSALTLGHARGAALLAAASATLPLAAYSPSTVKAHVSGYGLADKQQVSWMVSRLLQLPSDLPPGDASDALALAICAADLMPEPEFPTSK
ncbi:MAG: crossover junction endodeoxyribonuclease RuvC [Vicinamibacteria bacterium]